MKDRITLEDYQQLNEEQQSFIQDMWNPENGDFVTDLSDTFVLVNDKVISLTLENQQQEFEKAKFLPLYSVGQLYDFIINTLEEREILLLNDCIAEDSNVAAFGDYVVKNMWFVIRSGLAEKAFYYRVKNKIVSMLLDTFSVYIDGEWNEKLEDEDFLEEKLYEKYGEEFDSVLAEIKELYPFGGEDDIWWESWEVFKQKLQIVDDWD